MAQYFEVHPENPQARLIRQALTILENGGVVVYPTDSSYALACHLDAKKALDRIRSIRQLDDKHNFTLVCNNLAQISRFAKISNESYRMIKALTPGAFTFVLPATREVPRRLQHPKRKSIGIRIPDHPVISLMTSLIELPLFTSTLILPGEKESPHDPMDIRERMEHDVDLVIDAGMVVYEPTTIIDLTGHTAEIIRQGKGDAGAVLD